MFHDSIGTGIAGGQYYWMPDLVSF